MPDLSGSLAKRLPGPDVTPDQLRDRSWWKGPELYLLVDDYDLVASPAGNPVSPLLELLPQARDIGLHLVITRRVGGAARALFEPVLQRLRELDSPGLLMSGNREEGPLLRQPAAVAPAAGPGHPGPPAGRLAAGPDRLVRSVSVDTCRSSWRLSPGLREETTFSYLRRRSRERRRRRRESTGG